MLFSLRVWDIVQGKTAVLSDKDLVRGNVPCFVRHVSRKEDHERERVGRKDEKETADVKEVKPEGVSIDVLGCRAAVDGKGEDCDAVQESEEGADDVEFFKVLESGEYILVGTLASLYFFHEYSNLHEGWGFFFFFFFYLLIP